MKHILSISNSFGIDACRFLADISFFNGDPIIVGVLYVGGCPLSRHVNNINNDNHEYEYHENGKLIKYNASIKEILLEKNWDEIVLQQASYLSGKYDSYYPYISELIRYVKTIRPKARISFHQTWSYEEGYKDETFSYYNFDSKLMADSIKKVTSKVSIENNISLIEVNPVIEKFRNLGYKMNRDGFHLSELGRYVASLVWYKFFFNKKITVLYVPKESSAEPYSALLDEKVCQEAIDIVFNGQ